MWRSRQDPEHSEAETETPLARDTPPSAQLEAGGKRRLQGQNSWEANTPGSYFPAPDGGRCPEWDEAALSVENAPRVSWETPERPRGQHWSYLGHSDLC